MCGIIGFIDYNKKLNSTRLSKMMQSISHRGPDDSGFYFSELSKANIGLGHQRLSIIELSSLGHQPMKFKDLVITYNGEIYNYSEIRLKLEQKGYTFTSRSDTEVILKAFHCWRELALNYFVGMFAIAIFDASIKTLYLMRDRAGVKPLYIYSKDGVFAFSSEVKGFFQLPGFAKEIDINAVGSYLRYGFIPTPYSIFMDMEKLKPGHIFEIDISKNISKQYSWWDVFDYYNKPKLRISVNEAENEIERILEQSIRLRMVSDVPVGIFLSGGYDSSLIAAIIQKERTERISTFSIGFKESTYNESYHAGKVAKLIGSNHTEFIVNHKDVEDEIINYPEIYDEPFNDTSGLLVSIISRLAVSKLKVVLTGDGAEEVFAGYDNYNPTNKQYNILTSLPGPLKYTLDQIANLLIKQGKNGYSGISSKLNMLKVIYGTTFSKNSKPLIFKDRLLNTSYTLYRNYYFDTCKVNSNNDVYNRLLAIDFKTRLLDDFLVKIDRATMHHSLEARQPLLDHRIIEFTSQLPCQIKCYNNTTKYLLKSITNKYLPKELMNRPKMGFALPIEEWFRNDLKSMFTDVLNETDLKQTDLFNTRNIINLRKKFLSNNLDYNSSKRLISIFLFQLWYKKWM